MPFYHYSQNNSGGSFDYDEAHGITHHMVIEAADAPSADAKLESIGGYFDGCDNGRDCHCCGDRWSRAWVDDGNPHPMVYATAPSDYAEATGRGWMPAGREIAIHHADGRVEWF